MTLRAVKPTAVTKRLKALFYGEAGVGKTTAAIQFPKPYLIDTERGAENNQYVELINKAEGAVFQTTDFDEIMKEVTTLLSVKHDYKTLIIDPFTIIYQDLCDKWAKKLAKQSREPNSDGTEFQRHRDKADTQVKQLNRLLLRLDMNVIITSHSKVKWQKQGRELLEVGNTFDCYKKLDYLFDLVFEIQKRGKERVGIVKKTRIESFADGDSFLFSYEEIANRYGQESLEKDSKPQVLATEDQIKEMKRLVDLLNITEETIEKWLDKANSDRIEEMTFEAIGKCIDFLKSKIKGEPV